MKTLMIAFASAALLLSGCCCKSCDKCDGAGCKKECCTKAGAAKPADATVK